MKTWVILFLLLLLVAVAFGLGRDLYSHEVQVVRGTVVSYTPGDRPYKWPTATSPTYSVKLDDGRVVDVATADATGAPAGSPINVIELATPWGQAWFKQGSP